MRRFLFIARAKIVGITDDAVGIITVPDKKEIIKAMEEIRKNPSNIT